MQIKNITKNNQSLYVFHVFTSEKLENISCKGNPAIVFLVDTLPSLKEHQVFLSTLKNTLSKQGISESITFVYISYTNAVCNLGSLSTDKVSNCEYSIRWFSSTSVIKRCGHGTLAAAAFVYRLSNQKASIVELKTLTFHSDSESLQVNLSLNDNSLGIKTPFYSLQLKQEILTKSNYKLIVEDELNICSEAKTQNDDGYIIFELENDNAVRSFSLSKKLINTIKKRALIISATTENQEYDIIFRYFAPFYGELEDNATGSAASVLSPFLKENIFSKKERTNPIVIDKKTIQTSSLRCYQASKNGGFFTVNTYRDSDNMSAKADIIEIIGQVHENIIND